MENIIPVVDKCISDVWSQAWELHTGIFFALRGIGCPGQVLMCAQLCEVLKLIDSLFNIATCITVDIGVSVSYG